MKSLKFKCTLLSDIILSQSSSSEGNQKTLDFIPGNNFLGIVASALYNKVETDVAMKIFHSGKVRFGDAHPSVDGIRGLKVPASIYYPKLGTASEKCYIHHLTDHDNPDIKELQLKQCREGFYSFKQTEPFGEPVKTYKGFTIKSAYNSTYRRSEDGKMFGYESLVKGLVLYFDVEVDDDNDSSIIDMLKKTLHGKKQIGRSRTAEFGLVDIEQDKSFAEISSAIASGDEITVYADGRLIFLDENKELTMHPTASQLLGLGKDTETDAEILWGKSQIRTFQYSPWNGKRHTYDADRCGIEKGSVFVVKLNGEDSPKKSRYIGSYQNEGFGKVIYNPVFLNESSEGEGISLYKLGEIDEKNNSKESDVDAIKLQNVEFKLNPVLKTFLSHAKDVDEAKKKSYSIVEGTLSGEGNQKANDTLADLKSRFNTSESFASQWSSIRNIAMVTSNDKIIEAIDNFLDHGVAQAKWDEQQRKELLDAFMQTHKNEPNFAEIMINLASEMAKKCSPRKENKR